MYIWNLDTLRNSDFLWYLSVERLFVQLPMPHFQHHIAVRLFLPSAVQVDSCFLSVVLSELLVLCGLMVLITLLSCTSSPHKFGGTILGTSKAQLRSIGGDAIVSGNSAEVDLGYYSYISAERT